MDKDARRAPVGIAGMSQAKLQGGSKPGILSPPICEEPRKPCVPAFLGAYESGEGNLLKEPAGGKHKLSGFVDAGVQRLRRVRAW
jgi:hypothetical protein